MEMIELTNDGKGLGFGIIGGRSTGVMVKTILPGGAAGQVSPPADQSFSHIAVGSAIEFPTLWLHMHFYLMRLFWPSGLLPWLLISKKARGPKYHQIKEKCTWSQSAAFPLISTSRQVSSAERKQPT